MGDADKTVAILACCLICLLVLLLFLYKKLNREADGEYTIQNIVYKKGGLRDRVRDAAIAVETRLGVQLWPQGDDEGEEMGSMEGGQASSSQQGDDTDGEDGDDEEDQDSEGQSGSRHEEEGDKSSLDSSEPGERNRLLDKPEENDEREEKQEKPRDNAEESGTGLQIDLKQFSGSAIWSEEGGEGKSSDVTQL